MPELPECETIIRQVNRRLGEPIGDWNFSVDWYHRMSVNQVQTRLVRTQRKGKNLAFYGESMRLRIHLRMSGRLHLVESIESSPDSLASSFRYCKNIFTFYYLGPRQTESSFRIVFTDTRGFGVCEVEPCSDPNKDFKEINMLGIDPLYPNEWTFKNFRQALLQHPNMYIATALMRQDIVAGIGNIYRSEILHEAGIHPLRRVERLGDENIKELFQVISSVLERAIAARGCSMTDHRSAYRDLMGDRGRFAEQLSVYQRQNQPCTNCGGTVAMFDMESLRRVYFCGGCQV